MCSPLAANRSVLSDVQKFAEARLAGMPDSITKSAAAATEFRRLQQQEQVAKETESRLQLQLEMQQQVNNQFMAHAHLTNCPTINDDLYA